MVGRLSDETIKALAQGIYKAVASYIQSANREDYERFVDEFHQKSAHETADN